MKLHNIDDIKPYYSSVDILMSFMNTIVFNENILFSDDSWPLEKGRNANFNIIDEFGIDILNKKENIYLKFFFKFITFLYLNRFTHKQPKRTGKRHSFRSSVALIRFLAENKVFSYNNGQFHDVSYLDKSFFYNFITYLENTKYFSTKTKKWVPLKNSSKGSYLQPLVNWHDIGEYLPPFFKLQFDPLLGKKTESFFPQEEGREPWKPIPKDEAMYILQCAINYLKNNTNSLMIVFENILKNSISNNKKKKLENYEVKNVYSIITSSNLSLSEDCPSHYFYEKVKKNPNSSIDECNYFFKAQLFNSIRLLISSAIVTILFSTGMRRGEFYSLKRDLLLFNNSEIPYIKVLLEKTEYEEEGRVINVPIPLFLIDVIKTLVTISKLTSKSTNKLFFNYFFDFVAGGVVDHKSDALIYNYLQRFSEHFNVKNTPRPHEFRKTIAWYMMTKTSDAAILLKELFSHRSLKMTLEYMHGNPLLQRELEELNKDYNNEIAEEITVYALKEKLAGVKGDRVVNALKRKKFKGFTNNELAITTKQFFLQQLNDKHNFLFITKLAYCVRSSTSSEVSPCMLQHQNVEDRVNLIPNPGNCNSLNCKDAIFTPLQLLQLKAEKEKYYKIIEVSDFLSEEEQNRVFVLNAKQQIKKLDRIIKKLEC